ncbi:MAG: hypothetical protein IKD72_05345 [Clostridia bacterium]|nr:hypothetical protein [Clostridia bacterium]
MSKIKQPNNEAFIAGALHVRLQWSASFTQDMDARLAAVQRVVDSECLRRMAPYTPFRTGALEHSATLGTQIGSGKIVQATPYARYLYYGEVYGPNIPIRENGEIIGFWSPPHKEPTGRPLQYDTTAHPLAGPHWFDRMKADHLPAIQRAAQQAAKGGSSAK